MRKILEKWKGLRVSGRLKYYIVTAVFIISVFFLSENNVIRWITARSDVSRQEAAISAYLKNIEEAGRRRDVLGSDLDSLETFARESFYFHEPDEEVFVCVQE